MTVPPFTPDQAPCEAAEILGGLYGDGIIGLKSAFTAQWTDTLREDIERLFEEAKAVPAGGSTDSRRSSSIM